MDVLTAVDPDRIAAGRDAGRPFWLDLDDPPPGDLDRLAEALGLHPMAVEDTREFGQRPKLDVYADEVLLVFYTAGLEGSGAVRPIEVHVYVGPGYVLTVRRDPCPMLDELHDRVREGGGPPLHEILDALTQAVHPVIDALEQRLDELEGEVLARPRREQLERIYRLRQEVRRLGSLMTHQRDHFEAAGDDLARAAGVLDDRMYLRDVGDHLSHLAGELHRQSEDLTALTSTYFNANADRLSVTATRLTILGTLFVLWTLVTGFFGQNFGWLVSHIDTARDFVVFGLGALLVPTAVLGLLLWLKRDDWF